MFRSLLLCLLILTALLWGSVWAIAQEKIFVEDDFEKYPAEKDIPKPWQIEEPGVKVAKMGAEGTKQSLVVEDEGAGRPSAYIEFPVQSKGLLTIEYFAYVEIPNASGDLCIYVLQQAGSYTISFRFLGGKFNYNNGGAWADGPAYEPEKWYHIAYIADLDKQTFGVLIDDMTKPALKDIKFRAGTTLSRVQTWGASGNAESIHYIDELRIYAGPYVPKKAVVEPSDRLAIGWGKIKSEY